MLKGMTGWRAVVPVVCLVAGGLFATSATTSDGTDLRSGRHLELTGLIGSEEDSVGELSDRVSELQREVRDLEQRAGQGNVLVEQAQDSAEALEAPVGISAVTGPGLDVALDDAPRTADGSLPPGARNVDDVVVHQQDVQSVLNALWSGGAEAIAVMGQRIISTGAVRCVGNVLLLYGRTYSPPYEISAVGDRDGMLQALDNEPGVILYRQAADAFGLGYQVEEKGTLDLPGYDGPVQLNYAEELR